MNNNKNNNIRDGYHLSSKYWQDWKKTLPIIGDVLFQVVLGIVLGDASIYRVSREALVKFEQGVNQKDFIFHLFELLKQYCFMAMPGIRYVLSGSNRGNIKSYWFKTFTHVSFSIIWDLIYIDGKKVIQEGLILNHLGPIRLAYWIMCDGSLSGRIMTLHTQGFTQAENIILSNELNQKFGFNTKVIPHKGKYFVIKFSSEDARKIHDLIDRHIIPSMKYKVPKK